MTQRTVVVLITAAVIFAAAIAGQADDALRWKIKQLQVELNRLQTQAATHAQLEADLENERRQKGSARQMLASVQQQLRDAQTSMVRGQEREAALQQELSQTQQRLARAEAESAQLQGAQQALMGLQDELGHTQSALADEQERHRTTRGLLAGVRQALEQASAAVVKLRWAQTRQDQANAAAQTALQTELIEAQQRQWQAEQDTVSLRQELSQAHRMAAKLQAQAVSARGEASDAQEVLAAVRQELADTRSTLAQEQGRYRVVAQVLSSTQQRLGEANALSVQLRAELDNVGRAAAVRQGMLASVQQQLRDAQTSMVRGQEREAALQQELSQTQQRLAQAAAESAQLQDAQQALVGLQDELEHTQSALAEEQERHRTTRGLLAGVRQALEQASAAVVKLRWAQTRQDQANAAAQTALQTELIEAQQRQWQADQDTVSLRQELSQAHGMAAKLQAQAVSARGEASDAQEVLAVVRQELADFRSALAQEQGRYRVVAQVLSSTQQALAESQSELGGVSRAAAVRQGMLVSVQQQLRDAQTSMVQDQERQAGLEQTLAQTQQALAQANSAAERAQSEMVRQTRTNEVRQSQMNRDLMEARAQGEAVQLILASVREELARTRRTLEQEQGRSAAQGEVLANTQAALSETSASLVEVRAALAEQSEAHANAQAALQSDKQQWVERYWDMEQQRNKTRQAMKRAERAYAETQQALDQTMRQARIDEIRQSQLSRDLMEAQTQGEGTQAALSETSASLVEVRAALAEQSEAHANAQAALQSDKQQWVERYWDMEQQRNKTRQAMKRAERAYAETQQALDQTMRQARTDEIRQSQLRRDLMEARQVLDRRKARRAEAAARVEAVADLVRQRFANEIQQNQLGMREGKRRVKLASAEAFDFIQAVELGERSVQTLNRLTEILQELPAHQVRFEVHTDNIPLRRGSRWPTNWELSTARAAKLARYLIDTGVAPERLSIGGYGEYRPVADNNTPEGRRQNRRVEVIIKPPHQ